MTEQENHHEIPGAFSKYIHRSSLPSLPSSELHVFHTEQARKRRGMCIVLWPLSRFYERLIGVLTAVYKVIERTLSRYFRSSNPNVAIISTCQMSDHLFPGKVV